MEWRWSWRRPLAAEECSEATPKYLCGREGDRDMYGRLFFVTQQEQRLRPRQGHSIYLPGFLVRTLFSMFFGVFCTCWFFICRCCSFMLVFCFFCFFFFNCTSTYQDSRLPRFVRVYSYWCLFYFYLRMLPQKSGAHRVH